MFFLISFFLYVYNELSAYLRSIMKSIYLYLTRSSTYNRTMHRNLTYKVPRQSTEPSITPFTNNITARNKYYSTLKLITHALN